MKITTAYALLWIATALAITVAIITIKSASPLWALLIPACVSFSSSDSEKDK